MVRPRKRRAIDFEPEVTYFKPRAVPLSELEEVELKLDELEALRLSDLEGFNQTESAEMMKVHQSTFQRTLSQARKKIADALTNGKAIKIQGGGDNMPGRDGTGPIGKDRMGFGRMKQGIFDNQGNCICPACGKEESHIRGQPCSSKRCPACGTIMTRKN